jgi:hypothetical protein
MNYVEYYQAPLRVIGYPIDSCFQQDQNTYVMYSSASCASTGELIVGAYSDSDCTNELYSESMWGKDCMSDDDDEYDNDDDQYSNDDDDYELVHVVFETFCS